MIRPIITGIIFTTLLCVSGCVRPYERTLVIEEVAPPALSERMVSGGVQPDAYGHVLALQSNKFWNEFVAPKINPPMITKDIRAGFSASTKSGRKTNGFIVFELRIRLRSGGKEAFEAIQEAYGEFIDHYSKEAVNNELGYWYNQLKTAADPIQRKRIEDKIEAMKAEKPISPRVILNEAPTEN